jgi:hypothetical protein
MRYLLEIIAAFAAHLAGKDNELTFKQIYPNGTYPGAIDPAAEPGAQFLQTSDPFYPSPWMNGQGEWADAYAKARDFVSQLTLLEKVNLTTGVGWEGEQYVGQVNAPTLSEDHVFLTPDRSALYHVWVLGHSACKTALWECETQTITASSLQVKLWQPLLIEAYSMQEAMLWVPNTRPRV